MAVMVSTSVGDMVIDLFTDLCPLATKNFLKLCKIKYYNNCLFHSVQKDFIVQTGDPTGTGSGGDSIYKFLYGDQARYFDNEIHPKLKHDKVGVVAMASAGENANASQFYITTRAELDYLDGKHTVFGELAEGIDALERINETFVDEKYRPFKNIRIKHTHILDDPFDDPPELGGLIPDKSPELKPPAEGEEVRLEDDWVPMDDNMEPAELEKSLRRKEAQSRAVVLEMIGDLPEADMKPPENVLFVCKLNPVTEEGDLELIFGRFGKVMSADIIRDYKSGDSLCYAFIEFETPEACEAAYFKMDNVLIDDRRIHVDFSQSVSHLWNRYRKFGTKNGDDEGANFAPGQHDKGRGCFKCGEVGHFAKECPNNGEDQKEGAPERPKYSIKETGGQRGNMSRRYDMVFEEEEEEVAQKPRSGDRREGEKQVQSGSRGRRSAEGDGRNGRWDGGRGYSDERALRKHGQERLQEIDRDRSRASGSRAYHERENERESRREAGSREGGVREQAEKYDREYKREERNTRGAHERENERGSRREAGSREGGVREQEKKYDRDYRDKRVERSPRRAREEEGLRKNAMKDRNSVVEREEYEKEREGRKGGRVQAPSQERGAKRSDVVDKRSTGDDWREGSSGAGTGMRGSSEKDTDGAKHGDSRKVSNKSRREHLSSGERSYQGSDYKRRERDHGFERESDDAYSRRKHR